MGLKKFEDFENHLAEEDRNALANDFAGASKDLLANVKNITGIKKGEKPGEIIIEFTVKHSSSAEEDIRVLAKVIGYISDEEEY